MSEKLKQVIVHWDDIDYTIVAEPQGYRVDYNVYKSWGVATDGTRLWAKDDDNGCSGCTSNLDDADLFLHGEVKWDGCSNWHFDEQDAVMIHCCERQQLLDIGEVMARCWDMTKHLCGAWDGD